MKEYGKQIKSILIRASIESGAQFLKFGRLMSDFPDCEKPFPYLSEQDAEFSHGSGQFSMNLIHGLKLTKFLYQITAINLLFWKNCYYTVSCER